MNIIKRYFNWLQKDNPTGEVTFYPELSEKGETTLKGVYIIGDLTGIPLLKFAAAGGRKIIRQFAHINDRVKTKKVFDDVEKGAKALNTDNDNYDVIIVGAGPAGISAAIEAQERGMSFVVLEATDRAFNTIEDFPKGKEMFYEPVDLADDSALTMEGGTKEKLLEHFKTILTEAGIKIEYNKKVEKIESLSDGSTKVITQDDKEYIGAKTVLAIGKSGNSRKLNVPGEGLPHVYTKLYDPADFDKKSIFVVGGGDTAIESAMLLAHAGNKVYLSYRKNELTRPKPDNIIKFNKMIEEGKIVFLGESQIKEIYENKIDVDIKGEVKTFDCDNVFVLIGRQLPYEFFEKSGIRIENSKSIMTWWWMAFSLAFANIVYFGKASDGLGGHANIAENTLNIFSGDISAIIFKFIAWLSVAAFVITGVVVGYDLIKNWKTYFRTRWHYIKYGFFAFVVVLYLVSFFGNKYFNYNLGNQDPYYWYGFIYTLTIALFGIRRIATTKKRYVTLQTISVFVIQALPLFIIPNYILPWMHSAGWLSPWIVEHVFLGGEWWRFVGFILAWPLFIWNVITDEPSMFWLVVSLIQTFVIIPYIVIKWGKGAYCSWICSCGALAETLGDEYRTLALHGPKAKKWENFGQVILFAIFIVSILHALGWVPSLQGTLEGLNNALLGGYKIIVDTFLAGTIGVGLYFFYSGRVWCRFACPLAALMHIYNKFSSWHILSQKKKCISCGLCTKVCHMGIDVMNYANKGKPLDDVECVNCSACVNVCPTGVLSFGQYKKIWKKK